MVERVEPHDHPSTCAVAFMGPTAAGKAALGREAARRLALPILVCDSVKVYRGLDIGSAKPTAAERAEVRHELVDLVEPDAAFSAGDYARLAWAHLHGGRGLFVGGTGFYLRAVAFTGSSGVAGVERSPTDPERQAFEAQWQAREHAEPGAIFGALHAVDPETARRVHPNNVVRSLRALWLCACTQGPISAARHADPPQLRLRLMLVVVDPEPDELRRRMVRRLDHMLAQGFLAEVEKLREAGYDARHKAMQSLGYRQLLEVVEGHRSLPDARQAILAATHQYARRQRAYLRTQLVSPLASAPGALVITVRNPALCPWDQIEAFFGGHSNRTPSASEALGDAES
jgi:tRNA dimethylallyltransferase